MMVAYELKKTLSEFDALVDWDELGWWFAFFMRKAQLEEKAAADARRRSRGRRS
jgi:hypothetical protein